MFFSLMPLYCFIFFLFIGGYTHDVKVSLGNLIVEASLCSLEKLVSVEGYLLWLDTVMLDSKQLFS
jgi:hypothetical protein